MRHDETKFDELDQRRSAEGSPLVQGSSRLGVSITNWTSNLIATAVVVIIGLACGTQLVSLWNPPRQNQPTFELAQSWPALQSCTLEFGDAPFRLRRKTFTGCKPEVFTFLQSECRQLLNQNVNPIGSATVQELKLIAEANSMAPAESLARNWRIFMGTQFSRRSPLPTVFGIRDDCEMDPSETADTPAATSRLVVWGIALPGDSPQDWTTLVATPAALERSIGLENNLLPVGSQRTLAISDEQGGTLIGFKGGELQSTITFYQDLAVSRNWSLAQPWRQTGETWTARFVANPESAVSGIHVQLNGNHTRNLSGVLMLQSNQQRNLALSKVGQVNE